MCESGTCFALKHVSGGDINNPLSPGGRGLLCILLWLYHGRVSAMTRGTHEGDGRGPQPGAYMFENTGGAKSKFSPIFRPKSTIFMAQKAFRLTLTKNPGVNGALA